MFRRPGRGGKGFPNRGIRCLRNKSRPLQVAVGVVTDIDLIAPELWVNAVKAVVNANVGKGFVNGSGDTFHEEGKSGVHVNVPDNGKPFAVTLLWRLIGLRMYPFVINDGKISGESPVKGVKGDDVAGADFRFELSLACAEETFYQATGSGGREEVCA